MNGCAILRANIIVMAYFMLILIHYCHCILCQYYNCDILYANIIIMAYYMLILKLWHSLCEYYSYGVLVAIASSY